MEPLTLILSGLISLISPVNFVGDQVAEKAIRAQFKSVEVLKVRIDNAPIHQPIAGKADKVRVAGRGLFPLNELRVEALELETDPININRRQLFQRRGRLVLEKPLGVGVRVVLNKEDIVRALKSPEVVQQLQGLLGGRRRTADPQAIKISNPQIDFLENQRIRLEADVQQGADAQPLKVQAETGITILEGRRVQFVDPVVRLNGTQIPDRFAKGTLDGLAEKYDLAAIETRSRIKSKILSFKLSKTELEVATFIQLPAGFKL
jgi:LmeA-like phospholipid-binding